MFNYSSEAVIAQERTFIDRVFGWMAVGLLITGLTAAGIAMTPAVALFAQNPLLFLGIVIFQLVMVWKISASTRLSATKAGLFFVLYSALNGVIFSFIFLAYTATSIAGTFFITAGVFATTAFVGWVTKTDLTRMGGLFLMGIIGIILASVVNIFLRSSGLYWLISFAGVFLFIGLTAYDMQKLKQIHQQNYGEEALLRLSVIGALSLYLDFVNMFLFMLRLFGNRR